MRKPGHSGFTLFELLVVMGLLLVLMLATGVQTQSQYRKSQDARRKEDLEKLKVVLYDYHFDTRCFPASLPSCGDPLVANGKTYFASLPCDPTGAGYTYETDGTACSQWFRLLVNLVVPSDSSIDRVGCREGCGSECRHNYGVASSNISLGAACGSSAQPTLYACSPGGHCSQWDNPSLGGCPTTFQEATCGGEEVCKSSQIRCKNSKGKHDPDVPESSPEPSGNASKGKPK